MTDKVKKVKVYVAGQTKFSDTSELMSDCTSENIERVDMNRNIKKRYREREANH